jgi:tetratricopeptide (TPR) repeat protein
MIKRARGDLDGSAGSYLETYPFHQDPREANRRAMSFSAISRPIRVFYSFAKNSQTDKNLFIKLKRHMSALRISVHIDDTYDSASVAEDYPAQVVEVIIDSIDIIVLLVSSHYLFDNRCFQIEAKRAVERTGSRDAYLIPVLLSPVDLTGTFLEPLTFLPSGDEPLSKQANVDDALTKIVSKIRGFVELISGTRSKSQFPLNNIPYAHNRFFTDRDDILTTLYNFFHDRTLKQTCISALTGPIGIGKTQIAVEYAYKYRDEYQATLWLDAASQDRFHEIDLLAELLAGPKDDRANDQCALNIIKHWLQHHEKWLFILDNLDNLELINQLIPLQSSGHVLVTMLSHITGYFVRPTPVAAMEADNSVCFLLRRAEIIREQTTRNELPNEIYTEALSIVHEVGGLSLALDQAGAYIGETSCSLTEYLELYRQPEKRPGLLARRGELAPIHPASIEATLSLAFKKITEKYPHAMRLLYLLAFLHPDAIPREMLKQEFSDTAALHDAIAILSKYALIQKHTDPSMLSIHRVFQAVLKEKLTRKRQRSLAMLAIRLVNNVFPQAEPDNWSACTTYFSQARRCAELIAEFHIVQKEAASLLLHLGSYCSQRAYYQEAEQYLTSALEIYTQAGEADQQAIAQTHNDLGIVCYKRGKYREAEIHYQRAREIRKEVYGLEHRTVAQTLNNLALLYKDLGKCEEAKDLYQCVLFIDERTLGPDHPDTATSLYNLALVYSELGDYAQAESLYQRAFTIEKRSLNAQHPDLALNLNIQAEQYEEQGNYQEAEICYQSALAIQEGVFGPEHPDIAQTLNSLAYLYTVQEKYQEAEEQYLRALDIYKKASGPDHPDTANALNNLAYLRRQQGRYSEAEELYRQALTIYERRPDSDHHHTANVLNNLGKLYHLMKKDELSEQFLRSGLEMYERVLGREHLETARSLNMLVELLIHQQRYEQAKPLYQRMLDICQRAWGAEHPDLVPMREQYAILLKHIHEQKNHEK